MDAGEVVAVSSRLPDVVLKELKHYEVFEILADAWRMTATKKAVAAYGAGL